MNKIFPEGFLYTMYFLVLLVFGGSGKFNLVQLSATAVFFLLVIFPPFSAKEKKLLIPPGFKLYLVFLVIYVLSLGWSADRDISLGFFWLFASGSIFWLFAYNKIYPARTDFKKSIVLAGIFFVGLSIFSYLSKEGGIGPLGLYKVTSSQGNHNHIGDYWAIVSVLSVHNLLFLKDKKTWTLVTILGLIILALSLSRAAYIALAAGLFYLSGYLKIKDNRKKLVIIILIFIAASFLILGTGKSLIFSRQFYFQSIAGLFNNPIGVGIGNFKFISLDPQNHIFGFSGRGIYAEGIIFEIISGLGILGFIFIYWFAKVSLQTVFKKSNKPVPEIAMFTALTVNFLFDYTYFIPAMLWLWFLLLGLSQRILFKDG